ncbi:UDP-2,4-diacetamido-2,4,6-trideoxy-beta-L-altropyranose hydrolase [Cobetia amphilecti]|uniref:UDP-2,4-diacetamido-2,4, 6-trideoxy-beta-L-altropyranose hydrolase n=1 Tax=Cobetia amphilecti TaxID=1055104 RepID=UPI00254C0CCB|nr:UDP-2,4-diacetamido-2,4,6-trideoxy-beta-L-altropyranose hydrolase [Cobetia amphilecti]
MSDETSQPPSPVVVFRADASVEIGTGHVMRCLTLAEALKAQGIQCHFLCREHVGHLIDTIQARGFAIHRLPVWSQQGIDDASGSPQPSHAHWLGVSWQQDAEACGTLLRSLAPDWLVVDHYALDARWEAAVLPARTRLLVIDDLADRPHLAHLLLDQNLGRQSEDYAGLVPVECQVLAGPQHAVLRPEFAERRESSLTRRLRRPTIKRMLISLGGVDKDNATCRVLDALNDCDMPHDLEITVVMGATAPWLREVKARARELPWFTEVVVNVSDMARRMAEADLAIGAAGSTSWERCCLGLPTLMLVLAENQKNVAMMLDSLGAAKLLGEPKEISETLPCVLGVIGVGELVKFCQISASIVPGDGTNKLVVAMQKLSGVPIA